MKKIYVLIIALAASFFLMSCAENAQIIKEESTTAEAASSTEEVVETPAPEPTAVPSEKAEPTPQLVSSEAAPEEHEVLGLREHENGIMIPITNMTGSDISSFKIMKPDEDDADELLTEKPFPDSEIRDVWFYPDNPDDPDPAKIALTIQGIGSYVLHDVDLAVIEEAAVEYDEENDVAYLAYHEKDSREDKDTLTAEIEIKKEEEAAAIAAYQQALAAQKAAEEAAAAEQAAAEQAAAEQAAAEQAAAEQAAAEQAAAEQAAAEQAAAAAAQAAAEQAAQQAAAEQAAQQPPAPSGDGCIGDDAILN